MTLRDLIDGLPGVRLVGDGGVAIREVTGDSRAVGAGDLFVAVRGRTVDGHGFVAAAIERGAAAVAVEAEVPGLGVPQVIVGAGAGARALGVLIGRRLGSPADKLVLVGVTGTNGKTTSTYVIESMLAAAGFRPGVIGTVNVRWPGTIQDVSYTTPTPATLHRALADMVAAGCTHAVLEVTSSALEQARLAGMQFAVAAFTNLTQDHLDVHGTMAAYRDAKRLLFTDHLAPGGAAVVNVDDPEGEAMAAGVARTFRVTAEPEHADPTAEIRVVRASSTVGGIEAVIATPRGELAIRSRPLIGAYNVANLALVVGIGEALGIPHAAIARGIAELPGVPGRVERVDNAAGLDLFVDYAHTPDALTNVLAALRPLTARRLICVFGCGGDRDPTKRPKMGAAVAAAADLPIVTSDNPRTEAPRAILDMILPAVPRPFFVDPDRRTAIRAAVAEATPGDVVLIAGKGHEDYQILGTTKIHFDDREEAAAAVALRPTWTAPQLADLTAGTTASAAAFARVVIDGRAAAPGDLYVAIKGERHDGHAFCAQAIAAGAAGVMVEHDVAGLAPALAITVADTRLALGLVGRAHRCAWGEADAARRLVAITGSSGKTTTKELTRAALGAAGATLAPDGSLNNETGVPLTLLGLRAHHRYAVVEMGMRGVGQIRYLTELAEPDVAVVVNAGTAHIELLGSTEAIARAKAEIWSGLRPGGVVVRPADDDRFTALVAEAAPAGARILTFGERAGADVRLVAWHPIDGRPPATAQPERPYQSPDGPDSGPGRWATRLDLEILGAERSLVVPMPGRHNAIDACAALAAAIGAGVAVDTALEGLARVRPAAMRSEIVAIDGRHVIVDCYNANPDSMAAALDLLHALSGGHRAVAVLGDMLELGDRSAAEHRAVGERARGLGLPVIALGQYKDVVAAAAAAPAGATTDDPADAAARALAMTRAGDWILVKASRGMRLERVVDALRARTGGPGAGGAA
jgi:murE/murF fusion protein